MNLLKRSATKARGEQLPKPLIFKTHRIRGQTWTTIRLKPKRFKTRRFCGLTWKHLEASPSVENILSIQTHKNLAIKPI
jgi:hypothetical protein